MDCAKRRVSRLIERVYVICGRPGQADKVVRPHRQGNLYGSHHATLIEMKKRQNGCGCVVAWSIGTN